MKGNFDYSSAFVADEPAISHTVENLLYRNHSTEYFILLEMCYKERCIFNQIHDDVAVSWSVEVKQNQRQSSGERNGWVHGFGCFSMKSFTLPFI